MIKRVTQISDERGKKIELKGEIEFKNVDFEYPTSLMLSNKRKALSNVNLEIESGKTTVLLGPRGSGKSSVAHLLMRLYDSESGEISMDGV